MELDRIYNMDCLEGMKSIPDKSIDLVITDPPYDMPNNKAGGNNDFTRQLNDAFSRLEEDKITSGFDARILDELYRVMKAPNIYLWCNAKQIPMYLKYFVEGKGCAFDILCWVKTNAIPTFNNKYLSDKEYCLYFRRGGYCMPPDYESAKTVFNVPINAKDKKLYAGHPTIKPVSIIQRLVINSSREGEVVLDPFMGSGTTAVACVREKRHFVGFEIIKKYCDCANERVEIEQCEQSLF